MKKLLFLVLVITVFIIACRTTEDLAPVSTVKAQVVIHENNHTEPAKVVPKATEPVESIATNQEPDVSLQEDSVPLPAILFDFERQIDGIPEGFISDIGAWRGERPDGLRGQITLDSTEFVTGSSSIRFSSDINTRVWPSIYIFLDPTIPQYRLSYSVKAENVRQEADQFRNAYIGFLVSYGPRDSQFMVNGYTGTFDWKEDALVADVRRDGQYPETVRLIIFKSVSGDL